MTRDKQTTYRIMSAIKSEETIPERMLGKAMWAVGLRYRKHLRKLEGKPDFCFIKKKIAIFCDGDFWHGNNWRIRGLKSLEEELANYSDFWVRKIKRNIERDRQVTEELERQGWLVIRFWESEIRKSADRCADMVLRTYNQRTKGNIHSS